MILLTKPKYPTSVGYTNFFSSCLLIKMTKASDIKLHKKYATSSYYARNITSDDVKRAEEVVPSDVQQIEDKFEGTPNRELEFVTKERLKRGKNRKFYAKRGYASGVDSIREANTSYSDRLNILQPKGSERPIPQAVDVKGEPVKQVPDAEAEEKAEEKAEAPGIPGLAELLVFARKRGVEIPDNPLNISLQELRDLIRRFSDQAGLLARAQAQAEVGREREAAEREREAREQERVDFFRQGAEMNIPIEEIRRAWAQRRR